MNAQQYEQATFGNGCFWCTEAVFQLVDGVKSAVSGYSGGHVKNPSYKAVCDGTTGHAEVIQITYDASKVSFKELLEVFFLTHDPTTLNRQGNDVGTQYRSAIFYHNEQQKKEAEAYIQLLSDDEVYGDPIVTEVTSFEKFYPAENYHQEYYDRNSSQPYCAYVVRPKIEKYKKYLEEKNRKE